MNTLVGATQWARATLESDVFFWKPDKWFKIWFFLIQTAFYKDGKQLNRGQCLLTMKEISDGTKATRDQVDSFLRWSREQSMLTTRKTTRGMVITLLNYAKYQTLGNYKTDRPTDSRPTENRQRTDTIEKNVKNGKNVRTISKEIEAAPRKKNKPNPYSLLPDEVMSSIDDRDRSFPRTRTFGTEKIDWTLDYIEHKLGRKLTGLEKWNRVYARHLTNKYGMKETRRLLEWISEPSCWWFDKVSQMSTVYKNADRLFAQMEERQNKNIIIAKKE